MHYYWTEIVHELVSTFCYHANILHFSSFFSWCQIVLLKCRQITLLTSNRSIGNLLIGSSSKEKNEKSRRTSGKNGKSRKTLNIQSFNICRPSFNIECLKKSIVISKLWQDIWNKLTAFVSACSTPQIIQNSVSVLYMTTRAVFYHDMAPCIADRPSTWFPKSWDINIFLSSLSYFLYFHNANHF